MARFVAIKRLGTVAYGEALTLQENLVAKFKNGSCTNTLLLLQHTPAYTVGVRTSVYSKEEEDCLKKLGADFYRTRRGGLITFHGPGQLVAYPILNLKSFHGGVRWYVETLEKVVIKMCSDAFGIKAGTSPHTGVWIADKKLAAIGVQVSRFITSHGIAINCNTDMSWFDHIVPCGIQGKSVTSLSQELGSTITVEDVIPHFLLAFQNEFNCTFTE